MAKTASITNREIDAHLMNQKYRHKTGFPRDSNRITRQLRRCLEFLLERSFPAVLRTVSADDTHTQRDSRPCLPKTIVSFLWHRDNLIKMRRRRVSFRLFFIQCTLIRAASVCSFAAAAFLIPTARVVLKDIHIVICLSCKCNHSSFKLYSVLIDTETRVDDCMNVNTWCMHPCSYKMD
jgi:hypothetical protein